MARSVKGWGPSTRKRQRARAVYSGQHRTPFALQAAKNERGEKQGSPGAIPPKPRAPRPRKRKEY